MPTLVQINTALNQGSTGRIAEGIANIASKNGWKCYIVHGRRYKNKSNHITYEVSDKIEESLHYLISLLFDAHGLGSILSTKRLIKYLDTIKPDIIHLHNIHGYYINYPLLFQYINNNNIPTVWTMHDCWPFTGHCVYFDNVMCNRWKSECAHCPKLASYPKSLCIDRSKRNFSLKSSLFTSVNNLTMIPVSNWLAELTRESFLKNTNIQVIHNGIDLNVFRKTDSNLRKKLNIENKIIILGVANGFSGRKGLMEFVKLAKDLNENYQIIMVGVSNIDRQELPDNIIAISKTNNQKELVEYYSIADIFLNPTYEDNFPTTNLESLACGTPVITYRTGGSPEAIDDKTGLVVEKGDYNGLLNAIKQLRNNPLSERDCRDRAERLYNREICFEEYTNLYNQLIDGKTTNMGGGNILCSN